MIPNDNKIYDLLRFAGSSRTIISDGSDQLVSFLMENQPEARVIEFPSGFESATWVVPKKWTLISASLICENTGETILSSEDNVLFVAPYSVSVDRIFSKNDLLGFVNDNELFPDSFKYEHRIAYDYNKRGSDYAISIPKKVFENLNPEHKFQLEIITSFSKGTMKIFEDTFPGESSHAVYLLSHFCHSGQVNDGLAGIIFCGRLLEQIRVEFPKPNYTYMFLSGPETIGSVFYLNREVGSLGSGLFSIFSEMLAAESKLMFTHSRRKSTYIDRLFSYVLHDGNFDFQEVDFRKGWGNDEMIFDSPGVAIPSVSIDRHPFPEYHTSADNLERFSAKQLEEGIQIALTVIRILERDFIPVMKFPTPPYLSRFNLYKDWTFKKDEHEIINLLLDEAYSGLSVFDIAARNAISLEFALNFYETLLHHEVIEKKLLNPGYTKLRLRDLINND